MSTTLNSNIDSFTKPTSTQHLCSLIKRPDLKDKKTLELINRALSEGLGVDIFSDDDIIALKACFGLHPSCLIGIKFREFETLSNPTNNTMVFGVFPPKNNICNLPVELDINCEGSKWANILYNYE